MTNLWHSIGRTRALAVALVSGALLMAPAVRADVSPGEKYDATNVDKI